MMKWCIVLFIFFCSSCSTEVNQALESASGNKMELYKVIMHYRFVDRDSEKYKAALFLIDNMKYHFSIGRITKKNDTLERWMLDTDSIYYSFSKGKSMTEFGSKLVGDSLLKTIGKRNESLSKIQPSEAIVDNNFFLDCRELSFEFLTNHIDNAFKVWKQSKFARHLSFDEFKEYILPYRSTSVKGFHLSGNEYNKLFHKYIFTDTSNTLNEHVICYNRTIHWLRLLNGDMKRTNKAGLYDLFSMGVHDCIDIANYGCNIMRACGIPTVVEFNSCYRDLGGTHFYCAIYDTAKIWHRFSPESSRIGRLNWSWETSLNNYRQLYGAQKDSPFFLRRDNEYVPLKLNSPCIKDVTSHLRKTESITLPFNHKTNNSLAYLAAFSKANGGILPVTWGSIDTLSNTVTFTHTLPYMVYFPIYYPTRDHAAFGDAFFITIDSVDGKENTSIKAIPGTDTRKDSLITLTVNRKFPRKSNMIHLAKRLVGGRFLGANKKDFSDAKVLYEIKTPPEPCFSNYELNNKNKYKYYRFEAPKRFPNANISMLEWITYKKFNYSNSMQASRPHIITPDSNVINKLSHESDFVKLLDSSSWTDLREKAAYDGNMQTAPSKYREINFTPTSSCLVTHLRFAPQNAENGIRAGDDFELYYWNDGWQYGGSCIAEYEYVTFDNVPANKLYWLVNKTRGNEELPFTMIDGKQSFLYYDILNK